MDQTDALEDWVSIKDNPFLDSIPGPTKLDFLVAWNEVDWKIAITCREKSRTVSDKESKGWSGIFSFLELKSIHEQMSLVHPSLGPLLPALPEEPWGLWSYITTVEPPESDICEQLMVYMKRALDICGANLLTSTLFEEHSYDDYFENISELRRRTYDDALARADDELKNVLFLRSGSVNMLDMAETYKLEDEALFKWNVALAELYNYLIQPFLDMRELAVVKLREARKGLQNPDFGKRKKDELASMFAEWNEHYTLALDRIQELYMEYYSKTVNMLDEVRQRMTEDKSKFGKKSFAIVALDRHHRTYEDFTLEKMQLLSNTKRHYENQRDKVKQELASLTEGEVPQKLPQLEKEVYKWQNRVYDVEMHLSREEEQLIRHQISAIKQRTEDEEDEFFDAVETETDLQSLTLTHDDPNVKVKLKELQGKMTNILKKRAILRNRQKKIQTDKTKKEKKKVEEKQQFLNHHNVQLKRNKNKEELTEKEAFIREERQKTMRRLQEYNMKKHPAPRTIKPRKKPASAKKTSNTEDSAVTKLPPGPWDDPDSSKEPKTASESVPTESKNVPATSGTSFQQPPPPPPCPPPALSVFTIPPPPLSPPPPISPGLLDSPPPAPLLPSAPAPPPPPPPPPPPSSGSSTYSSSASSSKVSSVDASPTKPAHDNVESITLSGIQAAKGGLRKVDREQKESYADPMSDMLSLIRSGVKLRPVKRDSDTPGASPRRHASCRVTSSDTHTQQLMEAIQRISSKIRGDDVDVSSEESNDSDFD